MGFVVNEDRAVTGKGYINILNPKTNEVLAFPQSMSQNDIERVLSDEENGTITEAQPSWYNRVLRPSLEKIDLVAPGFLNAVEGMDMFKEKTLGVKIEPDATRAFTSTYAKEATFGAFENKNPEVQNITEESKALHPIATFTGALVGQTQAILMTAGLGNVFGLGKVAAEAGARATTAAEFFTGTKAAGVVGKVASGIVGGAGVGALYGGIKESVSQFNSMVEEGKNPDLLKVGQAALKDAGVFALYGSVGAISSAPVATTAIAGTAYVISKAEGASEQDALLNAAVMGIFHAVNAKTPTKEELARHQDALDKVKADYTKSMNPLIDTNIVDRAAIEHTMVIKDMMAQDNIVRDAQGKPIEVGKLPDAPTVESINSQIENIIGVEEQINKIESVKEKIDVNSKELVDLRTQAENIPETININTKERLDLRKNISDKAYGTGAKNKNRRIDLVLGIPAAGKGGFLKRIAEKHGSLDIDNDLYKESLPEYNKGIGAQATHKESTLIEQDIIQRAFDNGDNIAIAWLGKNAKKISDFIDYAKSKGYDVNVTNVNLPIEEAQRRAISRYKETGRFVDPWYIEKIGLQTQKNNAMLSMDRRLSSYEEYSTDVPRGSEPKKVSTGTSREIRSKMDRSGGLSGEPANKPEVKPAKQKFSPFSEQDITDIKNTIDWESTQTPGGMTVSGGMQTGAERKVTFTKSGHSKSVQEVGPKKALELLRKAQSGEKLTPKQLEKVNVILKDYRDNVKKNVESVSTQPQEPPSNINDLLVSSERPVQYDAEGNIIGTPSETVPFTAKATEGTVQKLSKASADINKSLSEKGFYELPLEEQAKYTAITKEEQIAKAADLIARDYEKAKDMATGRIFMTGEVNSQVLFNAVKNKALAEMDIETLRDLSASPISTERSLAAQTLSASGFDRGLAEGDPVAAMEGLAKTRTTEVERTVGKEKVAKEKKTEVEKIKKSVKEAVKKQDWAGFIKSLEC